MKTGQRTLTSTLSLALLLGASSFAMAQGQPAQAPTETQGNAQEQAQGQPAAGGYMATQTQPASPGMWDPQRVEQSLEELGFSDISDIQEENGRWRFTATREHTFDPQTGRVVDPTGEQAQGSAAVGPGPREATGQPDQAADQAGGSAAAEVAKATGQLPPQAQPNAGQPGQQAGAPPAGGFMATQTQPASPEMLDPEGLEQGLAQEGFSDVSEIRREGAQWRFSARKDNQDLDLTFDPQSGEIRDQADKSLARLAPPTGGYMDTQTQPAMPEMWDPERIEESLSGLGYGEFGEPWHEGGQWRLDAQKDGRTVELFIDPQTGEIFTRERIGSLGEPAGGGQTGGEPAGREPAARAGEPAGGEPAGDGQQR